MYIAKNSPQVYLFAVHLQPLSELRWAYQLHYYICFRTRWRRQQFGAPHTIDSLTKALIEVCDNHEYHLLKHKVYSDHLRCLVSLKPKHQISRVVNTLKSNISRQFCADIGVKPPLWATGYLARSIGRVRINAVKKYLADQADHHGFGGRVHPPVSRYRATKPVILSAAHAVFDLTHHVVLATNHRRSVFTSKIGSELVEYWLTVAHKHGFAINEATVLPDHVHSLISLPTTLSIENCVLSLMNNGQYWLGKQYPQSLIREGIDQLWQPSAYAGTCGEVTTAQVKAFLGRE